MQLFLTIFTQPGKGILEVPCTYFTSVPVIRQRHVVALVDANAAVGAVVRRHVVDVDVVAAPNCDGAANEPK